MPRHDRRFCISVQEDTRTLRIRSIIRPSPITRSRWQATVFFCFWAAACLCGAFHANASLRIVGTVPHAALWQQLYDQMPSCWKTERTIVVQELSDAEMISFIARHGGKANSSRSGNRSVVDGCYQKGGDTKTDVGTIRLCAEREGQRAELIFAHEYGHFIWDEKLTKGQRACFKRIWRQQKEAGHLVTKYAGEDVEEGFAEVAAYFLRQPAVLRQRDPDSHRFLSSLPGMEKTLEDTIPCGDMCPSCSDKAHR